MNYNGKHGSMHVTCPGKQYYLDCTVDVSDVAASDVTKCTELAHSTKQLVSCGNLHILKSQGGAINIETNGGHLHGHCLMSSASFGNICINAECLGKIIMNEKEHTTDIFQIWPT